MIKSNIKSKILAVMGLLLTTQIPFQAKSADGDSAPVMIGSACNYQIRVPENAMGYIPSGDCKTIYVLPAAIGEIHIPAFMATAHTLLCASLNDFLQNKAEATRSLAVLNKQLRAAKSDSERNQIIANIEAITKYANAGADIYTNKDAAYAQLIFKNAVDQKILDQWAVLNLEVIRTQGVSFRPAPVGMSVLTFTTAQALSGGDSAVISATIPGLTKLTDGSQRSILFQGSLSGQVVFSLYGACGLLNKIPQNISELVQIKPDPKNVAANLIANQEYEVSTRNKMSYKATLKKKDAIDFLNQFEKERQNSFTVSEFVNRFGKGNIEDLVHFELRVDQLSGAQLEQWQGFKQNFYQDVVARLTTRMVNELARLDLLQVAPYKPEDAPQAGTGYVQSTQRVCSSSSFLGITIGGSCHDQIINFPVAMSGRSSLIDNQALDTSVVINESLSIDEPYPYSFTSAFAPIEN